jgi:N-acetyl-anhydromuramyl-L-alanine amidase AmpD
VPLLVAIVPVQAANLSFAAAMDAAAQARRVPLPLVEAIAYVNTSWEWNTIPAGDGGVGPMNILPGQIAQAAALSGHSPAQITTDLASNLDAGSALLSSYHTMGADLASWQSAVVSTQGSSVAAEVFDALRAGARRTTSTGETVTLEPQALPMAAPTGATRMPLAALSTDYAPATWVPASTSNYTVANRAHDHPIDMIVIHDIEGSYGSAIQMFQNPGRRASAHYIVSYKGQITQMVRDQNIAWHAGNWDYNTRAIGIEHEGFAWTSGLYTTAEYDASAHLAASICSRWGVPMDRQHVIGHNQVPDPYNPRLFGGAEHHTDPGPYWAWTYYMAEAKALASKLPSPPHMTMNAVAVNGLTSATVTWQAARSCHLPISGYTVAGQPGNLTMNLPPTATSASFNGLQPGVSYTFTVTAVNADGQDSVTSNPAIPGRCNNIGVSASPASPAPSGTPITLTAASSGCPNPQYAFWVLAPGATTWQPARAYSSAATWTWDTSTSVGGTYQFSVWAQDAGSPGTFGNSLGRYDDFKAGRNFTLTSIPCTSIATSASPPSPQMRGASTTIGGTASGCPHPSYQFWILNPGSARWQLAQDYTPSATLTWSTTGKAAGTYRFSIWARDASSAGTYFNGMGSYDAFNNSQYFTVTPGCAAVGVSTAPASPSTAGIPVTITGGASGCPTPSYQFWVLYPQSVTWRLAQPYSTSATFDWSTTGLPAGTYRFSVWVQDAASPGTYANSMGRYDAFNSGQLYILR